MNSPVALFIFNRPDEAKLVFQRIKEYQPPVLFIIADGPHDEKLGEAEKCEKAREIIKQVDWKCEVFTHLSEVNLGCKKRIFSGLELVFSLVEEAILLEDDCVPHPSFFPFCEQLLERYRHDSRIMSISGSNFQFGRNQTGYSYQFSHFFHCWGWASWRRAWEHCDLNLDLWPQVRNDEVLYNIFQDRRATEYWTRIFEKQYRGENNSWAYSTIFSWIIQNGLHIHPNHNLTTNIGFSLSATNTKVAASDSIYANMDTSEIQFPLEHPPYVIRNVRADKFTQQSLYDLYFLIRASRKLVRVFKKLVL